MAKMNITTSPFPRPKLDTAGPGQTPAIPQPRPKMAAPDSNLVSIFLLVDKHDETRIVACIDDEENSLEDSDGLKSVTL